MKLLKLLTVLGSIFMTIAIISSICQWSPVLSMGSFSAGLAFWLWNDLVLLREDTTKGDNIL